MLLIVVNDEKRFLGRSSPGPRLPIVNSRLLPRIVRQRPRRTDSRHQHDLRTGIGQLRRIWLTSDSSRARRRHGFATPWGLRKGESSMLAGAPSSSSAI